MRDVVNEAIIAHIRWKKLLEDAIETSESKFTVEDTNNGRNCVLGKWISLLNNEHKKEYDKINEVHLKFHRCAARVLKLALVGKKKEARKAIVKGSRYELYSIKLIGMLTKINEKLIVV